MEELRTRKELLLSLAQFRSFQGKMEGKYVYAAFLFLAMAGVNLVLRLVAPSFFSIGVVDLMFKAGIGVSILLLMAVFLLLKIFETAVVGTEEELVQRFGDIALDDETTEEDI